MIRKIVLFCLIFALGFSAFDHALGTCANCTPPKCEAKKGGANPFDIFSANVYREVDELSLATEVGEYPLRYGRKGSSRPAWAAQPRNDFPMGNGGNWRHSFQWTILDDGLTPFGSQKLQVIDHAGVVAYYHKKSSNDLHMTYLPSTQERMLQEGTNYFLFYMDGTRYHITEREEDGGKNFRMEGFLDPFKNPYTFRYDEEGLLAEVTGPNTNQYFRYEYERATNAVDPGLVRFSYVNTNASEVFLAGTFNGWTATENPMVQTNGEWMADVELEKGFHAYKFVVRYPGSGVNHWVADPDNPITGGADSNSVAVVDPFRLISRVEASDGRSVSYRYDWAYNGHPDRIIDINLMEAEYGDGLSAVYT